MIGCYVPLLIACNELIKSLSSFVHYTHFFNGMNAVNEIKEVSEGSEQREPTTGRNYSQETQLIVHSHAILIWVRGFASFTCFTYLI